MPIESEKSLEVEYMLDRYVANYVHDMELINNEEYQERDVNYQSTVLEEAYYEENHQVISGVVLGIYSLLLGLHNKELAECHVENAVARIRLRFRLVLDENEEVLACSFTQICPPCYEIDGDV